MDINRRESYPKFTKASSDKLVWWAEPYTIK